MVNIFFCCVLLFTSAELILASEDASWSFWTHSISLVNGTTGDVSVTKDTPSSAIPQLSRLLADDRPSISQPELDKCVRTLKDVAVNNRVDRQSYVTFLEEYSGRSLIFSAFDDLPLSLVLIFYTAACSAGGIGSGGGRCGDIDPKIRLNQLMPAGGAEPSSVNSPLLIVFCTTIKDVAAIQIEFLFQYLIRYSNGMSAQQVLVGSDGDTVKDDLERATELVLLDYFDCDLPSTQRRMRERLVSSELQRRTQENIPWNITSILMESANGTDSTATIKREKQRNQSFDRLLKELRLQRREEDTEDEYDIPERSLQRIGIPKCDYRVSARIRDIVQIGEHRE